MCFLTSELLTGDKCLLLFLQEGGPEVASWRALLLPCSEGAQSLLPGLCQGHRSGGLLSAVPSAGFPRLTDGDPVLCTGHPPLLFTLVWSVSQGSAFVFTFTFKAHVDCLLCARC